MKTDLRQILFHVRTRIIQVRERLAQEEAMAELQPMTVGEAVGYLEQAINLELARLHGVRITARAKGPSPRYLWGKLALESYLEAKGANHETAVDPIPELIADLLHLASVLNLEPDPVESTLEKARLQFAEGQK